MGSKDGEKRVDIFELTTPTTEQAADYIGELLTELIAIAKAASLPPIVGHLMGMLRLETDNLLEQYTITKRAPKNGQ